MTNALKHVFAGTVVAAGLTMAIADQAFAVAVTPSSNVSVTGTLTADNHYGLFFGNNDGSSLTKVGRNEYGWAGSQGGYNWSNAETWNFEVNPDDYLYIVVWDDMSVDESWVGEFNVTHSGGSSMLYSKAESWEYITTAGGVNPGDWGETPGTAKAEDDANTPWDETVQWAELNWEISGANNGANAWTGANSRGANNGKTGPWGKISEVSDNADFLNTTTNTTGNKADNTKYTIFRTRLSLGDSVGLPPTQSVPEPASVLGLLAVGAMGLGTKLKRKADA